MVFDAFEGLRTCLQDKGRYYDDEYHKHVMKEPGEVLKVAEQCELIYGRRSVLCATAPEDICLFMRCTIPKTGICEKRFHGAARGSECGRDKWCIDGLCVHKRSGRKSNEGQLSNREHTFKQHSLSYSSNQQPAN
ncbi:hypothetical protein CHS0354_009890 [Potamilus streckersoni]|uniref:ADAMTS cysteine-rich domain-containing protein n=1 Tax=Potamilus streckersoni TaxID=2493646 RepID=A0AAE0S4D6_9BIVA|nr:hypothetical protein CHS0354_009890 [Potamilus streckersoni]